MEDAGFVPCPVSSGRVVVGGLFVANESDWVKWFVVEMSIVYPCQVALEKEVFLVLLNVIYLHYLNFLSNNRPENCRNSMKCS